MPNHNFHIQKRDGFRDSGEHLQQQDPANSADAVVQDFFYVALHDVKRFLSLFGIHSRNHRRRKQVIADERIIQRRGRIFIGDPARFARAKIRKYTSIRCLK